MGATTTEETTVTVTGPDGETVGPFPANKLGEHGEDFKPLVERALTNAGHTVERDVVLGSGQLSFALGTGRKDAPDFASLKIAGQLAVEKDLLYGQPVTIMVTDSHGEVIAEGSAAVGYPAFKDHFDKHGGKTVERMHVATLE